MPTLQNKIGIVQEFISTMLWAISLDQDYEKNGQTPEMGITAHPWTCHPSNDYFTKVPLLNSSKASRNSS
jgi:hypothetical protein